MGKIAVDACNWLGLDSIDRAIGRKPVIHNRGLANVGLIFSQRTVTNVGPKDACGGRLRPYGNRAARRNSVGSNIVPHSAICGNCFALAKGHSSGGSIHKRDVLISKDRRGLEAVGRRVYSNHRFGKSLGSKDVGGPDVRGSLWGADRASLRVPRRYKLKRSVCTNYRIALMEF